MDTRMLITVLMIPLISSANYAYAQEPGEMEQVTPNGQVKVQLIWPQMLPDQLYDVGIKFLDPATNQPLTGVTIGYDVIVLQHNATVEHYTDESTNTGFATFEVMFPEDGAGPAEVTIAVTSITKDMNAVEMDETVSFNVQVVPEFSALAVMVMAVSIAALISLTRLKSARYFF